MNSTNVGEYQSAPGIDDIIFGMTLIIVSLVATLGNLFVLGAIYNNPSLRSATDHLLANLAVADLLQASLAIPLRTVDVFGAERLIPCHIVLLFSVVSGGASNMTVLLVSVDRVIAIKQSLRYYTIVTPNRVLACISCKWLLLLIFAILPIAGWGKPSNTLSTGSCRYTETLQRDYVVLQSVLLHVFPVVAVLLIYVVILKAACRHSKAIRAQEVRNQTRHHPNPREQELSTTAMSTASETLRNPQVGHHTPRQARALKTISILVGVFIVLVLPIIVIDVVETWAGPVVPDAVVKVAICMIYANSGVNVFIYTQSNKEYRRTFKRFLKKFWCNAGPPL